LREGWLAATLAEKIPEHVLKNGLGLVHSFLSRESKGLLVKWELGTRQGWLEVRANGEDAEAFLNILKEKLGTVPVQYSGLEKWDVAKGFLVGAGRVGFGVYVDVGILEPAAKDGLYPLHRMRAQLADGVAKSCREILDENGLTDNFPVKVLVTGVEGERVSLELSDETRLLLQSWKDLPFERVVAMGVSRDNLAASVKRADLQHDVIRCESLSLFCHCLVCKVGTEAPGVISKIGGQLKGVSLRAFRGHVE
jgi:hypothetical protein